MNLMRPSSTVALLFIALLRIICHADETSTLLGLCELTTCFAQALTEGAASASVGRNIPDLHLGLGTTSGESQRRIWRPTDGKDLALIEVRFVFTAGISHTTPKSRPVTKLISRLPPAVSSSLTFQILTCLSIPPVAIHPRM